MYFETLKSLKAKIDDIGPDTIEKSEQYKIDLSMLSPHQYYMVENFVEALKREPQIPDEAKALLDEAFSGGLAMGQNMAIYSRLITLCLEKVMRPNQDIRRHKVSFEGGFCARSLDHRHVTPFLSAFGLPCMSSGGSGTVKCLEQNEPYRLRYSGAIKSKYKKPFLELVAFVNQGRTQAASVLQSLFRLAARQSEKNKVSIIRNYGIAPIHSILQIMKRHRDESPLGGNSSKLCPIQAYATFKGMFDEHKVYSGASLKGLGKHTTCDRSSKSPGDIHADRDSKTLTALEAKSRLQIESQMMEDIFKKIRERPTDRYFVVCDPPKGLPVVRAGHEEDIEGAKRRAYEEHGCNLEVMCLDQYLRSSLLTIDDVQGVLDRYITMVQDDKELDAGLKVTLDNIIKEEIPKASV